MGPAMIVTGYRANETEVVITTDSEVSDAEIPTVWNGEGKPVSGGYITFSLGDPAVVIDPLQSEMHQ